MAIHVRSVFWFLGISAVNFESYLKDLSNILTFSRILLKRRPTLVA